MDPDNTDPNKLAADLAKLQQQVTGLSDENPSDANASDPSGEVSNHLQSAKKVMELLDRMRPIASANKETQNNFNTPETVAEVHPANPISKSEIPQSIGRFEIHSLLGRGGFSLVFKAHDPRLERVVALKVPTLDSMLNPDSVARFEKESRALATLSHPNIVPVFEEGNDGPISYIASAYIEGTNLSNWIEQHGPASQPDAATACSVIADAIQHAHNRGIVHRDLKPANILLKQTQAFDVDQLDAETIYVTDFGLAKVLTSDEQLTQTGNVLGTPAFAAPEQLYGKTNAKNASAPELADVYSIGAILYFLLTGKPPHSAANLLDLVQQVKLKEPVNPSSIVPRLSPELSAICL